MTWLGACRGNRAPPRSFLNGGVIIYRNPTFTIYSSLRNMPAGSGIDRMPTISASTIRHANKKIVDREPRVNETQNGPKHSTKHHFMPISLLTISSRSSGTPTAAARSRGVEMPLWAIIASRIRPAASASANARWCSNLWTKWAAIVRVRRAELSSGLGPRQNVSD